ncbi:MAG TPA: hypothetical protein VJ696_06635 [Rhodanobacteraceae bacterium]|nr:hypothetical protein [Rhodanobacteraceae bacterium]
MDALQRITERVNRNGDPNDPATPRPLLTVAEFFDGNTDTGSIGCNLWPNTPEPAVFRALFERIAARDDVRDVRIQITDFDGPEWPFTDTVYIMTSATQDDVASWFDESVRPDEFWEGFHPDCAYEPYVVPAGVRPIACWWD